MNIETDRLILRPQEPIDYEIWQAGFLGRLPSQHRYDDGCVNLDHCDRAWFTALCQQHQESALKDELYVFGIFHKDTQQHLGNIDFSTLKRDQYQWAILGYEIHNQFWKQGFGKEAVRAALQLGFEVLNYQRIEAVINVDNSASIALAESVGMYRECIRRKFLYENDEWVDHLIYVALSGSQEPPRR